MWEEKQEIKWDRLFMTFYKISVLTSRFYCTFFSATYNSKKKKKKTLGDTWIGLTLYIKLKFLSENIIFNPVKTLFLGLAGCVMLPFHYIFPFYFLFIWPKFWTRLNLWKDCCCEVLKDNQCVSLQAWIHLAGSLQVEAAVGNHCITPLRQTVLLLDLLFLPCCLTGMDALTSSAKNAN